MADRRENLPFLPPLPDQTLPPFIFHLFPSHPNPSLPPSLPPFLPSISFLISNHFLFLSFLLCLLCRTTMHHPQPHICSPSAAASAAVAAFDFKPAKRRGSYNCGRCGLPKKGHVCHVVNTGGTPSSTSTPTTTDASSSAARPPHIPPPPPRQPYSHLRRALSFGDIDIRCDSPELDLDCYDSPFPCTDLDPDNEVVSGGLPAGCLWEVLRRLPPAGLMAAARVCKGWRETTKRLWRAAEELRLRVPPRAQLGFIGLVLQKCPSLVRLSLKMERFGSKLILRQI